MFKRKILFSPNLFLEVFTKEKGIANDLMQFMKQWDDGFYHFQGSTIIYCPTRKQAEEVCRVLDGDFELVFVLFYET